jgi:hypothetical protein
MYVYIYIYTHTHTYTYIYTHTRTHTHKISRYFENHSKYFKLPCKLYFTVTWVISNAECTFNRLSEFRKIRFPLRKVIRQCVSLHLWWNTRCSYCCVLCLLHGRLVQKKSASYCVVLPRTYVTWKTNYVKIILVNTGKFREYAFRAGKKKIGNSVFFCMMYS